jgi:peptidyl-prolyl cis-trans isomerase D
MLQTIREKLTGWFAVAILGLIGLSLVVTLGNIDTGVSSGAVAATINGEDILQSEFRQLYQQQAQQWEASTKMQMPEPVAAELANSVIQSLVRNRVVAEHVRKQGYRINDEDLIAAVMDIEAFQVGGKFSQPAYDQVLRSEGLSSRRFEYEQRQAMQIGQFIDGLGYSSFYTPAEFRRYIELDGETRDLEYLLIRSQDLTGDIEIEDAAIETYYRENPLQFQSDEFVSLSFIEVNFDKIASGVAIGDDEAQAYFDANPDEFIEPDARNVRHILLAFGDDESSSAELARQLRERVLSGESFEALAAEYSSDTGTASTGGDLGWLGAGDSPASEFEDALLALDVGEISEPVRTEFGYHLIRLDDLRKGKKRQFAEVKAELLQQLREAQAMKIYGDLVDELDERALESIDGLAGVAEALKLPLNKVEKFTRSGGGALGNNPSLVEAVFSLEVLEDGENTSVIELSEGRAVVAHVDKYSPSALKPLDEVREAVIAELRNSDAIARAANLGNEMISKLESGADSEALAMAEGLSWQRMKNLRRADPDMAPDFAAAVFQAPKPVSDAQPSYRGIMLASGDFAVYRVSAVKPGSPSAYSREDRDARERQLAGRLGGGQATAVVEALVAEAKISISPDLLGTQTDIQ